MGTEKIQSGTRGGGLRSGGGGIECQLGGSRSGGWGETLIL